MLSRRLLPVVLLSCVPVLATQESVNTRNSDNLAELNNHLGQTPCTIGDEIVIPCQSSRSRRAFRIRDIAATSPIPTNCTCNNVFFNIWSACLLIQGNATLPAFDDWGSECRNKSQNLTAGIPVQNNVVIPSWAFANVTGGSTFNVDAALLVAKKKSWTTVQIVIPIVVGVGVLALALFGFFLYRRKSKKQTWLPSIMHCPCLRPRVYRVRKARRDGPWSIDRAEETEEYSAVAGDKRPPSHQFSKGHARLSSSETVSASLSDHMQHTVPLKSRIAHQLRSLPDFQFPWRARAIEVRNQPPRRGFRVDSWDVSTSSGPSNISSTHSRMAPTETGGAGRSQTHDTILEEDEGNVEASLLSPVDRSENSVFFIGHRAGGFPIESGSLSSKTRSVQVIPPTPTESSHPSAIRQSMPLPTRTQLPPPPTQPAPLPPSFRRDPPQLQRPIESLFQTERFVSRPNPINIPPINPPHSPLVRYDSPENVVRPVHAQHVLPRVASPSSAGRQLPMAPDVDHNTVTFRPLARPGGLASPSSIESLYVAASFTHPAPSHQRSLADIRPAMGPRLDSPPIISTLFSPGLSFEEELARQDQIPSRSSSRLHHTRSPSPHSRALTPTLFSPRRRGTDDSSFTLESLHPSDDTHYQIHSRNVSSESVIPGRGDAVMLFPGSVRGAGYAPQSPPPAIYPDRSI